MKIDFVTPIKYSVKHIPLTRSKYTWVGGGVPYLLFEIKISRGRKKMEILYSMSYNHTEAATSAYLDGKHPADAQIREKILRECNVRTRVAPSLEEVLRSLSIEFGTDYSGFAEWADARRGGDQMQYLSFLNQRVRFLDLFSRAEIGTFGRLKKGRE